MDMAASLLLLTLCQLVPQFHAETLPAGPSLTMNSCGDTQYYEYQDWYHEPDGILSLYRYTNNCLICSGAGYCSTGMKPIVADYCDSSDYRETFIFTPVPNKFSTFTIQVNGLCLTMIGMQPYASIQTLPCNYDQSASQLQQFVVAGPGETIRSLNDSLCLTAMYYPLNNCSVSTLSKYPYCNASKSVDQRVEDLVNRMNIYEKIDNLAGSNIGVPRLGVPPNKVLECLHGVFSGCGATTNGNTGCPTSFPNALLLGATFNRTLWNKIGIAISDEGRALDNQNIGGLYCFSPNINLFRDPRWGRGQEVPGEDPYLTSQYAIQYIYGIQFGVAPNSTKPKYLKMSNTVKHYIDYDLEGCRYGVPCRTTFDANVSAQDQTEYYSPAWRAAILAADAQSVCTYKTYRLHFCTTKHMQIPQMMCSYNAINGVPACGNSHFMNAVARQQLGFSGFIISDAGAITDDAFTVYVKQNANGQNDPLTRVKLAIENGCDADLGDGFFAQYMHEAYTSNKIKESDINTAVSRWMTRAFMLGQMDDPNNVPYKQYGPEYVDSAANRKLALDAAQQGIVLLKNENNNTLPLSRGTATKYAFIGPHFNITQYMLSSYRGDNTLVNSHSPYQIAKKQGIQVEYALGCDVQCDSTSGFQDAVNVAKSVDKVIMFMGLYPIQYAMPNQNYSQALESENHDRENVTFPGYQLELLQQVQAANPNITLVMIHSAQIDLTWPKQHIPAIVHAFYPGELGGDAIISVLFGDVSPAGKLPYTLYNTSITQRSITDMSLSNNGGITYMYYKHTPVYPFGFGLSYTTFVYKVYNGSTSATRVVSTSKLADWYRNGRYFYSEQDTQYIVQVTNTGSMDSDCVVLAFVADDNVNATSPQIKLVDFDRVYVPIGKSVNVTLSFTAETISFANEKGQQRILPGDYTLYLGDYPNKNYVKKSMKLVGKEEVIFDIAPQKQ